MLPPKKQPSAGSPEAALSNALERSTWPTVLGRSSSLPSLQRRLLPALVLFPVPAPVLVLGPVPGSGTLPARVLSSGQIQQPSHYDAALIVWRAPAGWSLPLAPVQASAGPD